MDSLPSSVRRTMVHRECTSISAPSVRHAHGKNSSDGTPDFSPGPNPSLTIESRTSPLENREIARLLWETADLMEIAGEDSFRIRSYRNGATAIEGHPERIADILRDPARKVTQI